MLDHKNVHNVLQTPKEMLVLQRTLKGVLDWQQHAEDSTVSLDCCWNFRELLMDMQLCLLVSDSTPSMCGKITLRLRRTSAELQSHMVKCTPLAVLHSVNELSYFASNRYSSLWCYETSKFLLNAAVEAFPDSHPSLLLLRLLFSGLTPSQLVMMYEVGSETIEQHAGETTSFSFRVAMHNTAAMIGLGETIRSYADALCAATPDGTSSGRLYDIAILYRLVGQYEKSADAMRRCRAQIEDEGDEDSSTSISTLQILVAVQSGQEDLMGKEITLHKILKIALARDRRDSHTSQSSIDALDAISQLDTMYADHNLNEQRDALHLEYPSAFEL